MGRIKTKPVKTNTMTFIEKFPDAYTTDFEKNKQVLNEMADIKSKKIRNAMAGYLVRKAKEKDN